MKKILFVPALIFVLVSLFNSSIVSADTDSFGTVGIEKIVLVQNMPSLIKITPTFFNLADRDQTTILEVSITDNYSEEQLMNVDKLTSEILDTSLVIPKQTNTYSKTYTYALPNISKKSTYKIELRVLDKNRNTLFIHQSDAVSLGNDEAPTLAGVTTKSWFEYDGKKYGLNDGPVVKAEKKDTAFYVVEVNNASTDSVSIDTRYSSRKYAALDAVFVKNEGIPVGGTIAKKSKGVIKVPARYFEENGTFEGKIDVYADQSGKKGLLRTDGFRYMIGDSFIVVTDAKLATTTLTLGVSKTLFDSTVELTDAVINSTTTTEVIQAADAKEYTFTATFKDKNGVQISVQQMKLKWGDIMPEVVLPVTLTKKENTQIEQVEVTIVDASGKSMFKNVFALSPAIVDSMSIKEIGVIVSLVFLILSLIGYFATRRKSWLVCILIFLAATLFVKYSNITATTNAIHSGNFNMGGFIDGANYPSNSGCWAHGYRGLSMQPSWFPGSTRKFRCGEDVSFKLDPVNSTCGNTSATTYFVINSTYGLTVKNSVYDATIGKRYVLVAIRGGASYPVTITLNAGFRGNANLKGYYLQQNGLCSSQTGATMFTFNNVTCNKTCQCDGRDNVCREGANDPVTTRNAAECKLAASCGVSVSGSNATFTTSVTHALGSLIYKDTDSGNVITNPITRSIPEGGTITQSTTVIDDEDGAIARSVCTANRSTPDTINTSTTTIPEDESCEDTNSCTVIDDTVPTILDFVPDQGIVPQGQDCRFSWSTTRMSLCTFKVNGVDMTPGDGRSGADVSISTSDGNNKFGILTCTSSTTPQRIISASTTCRVNPEVRQQ